RHLLLEIAGDREVEGPRTGGAPVLEVVGRAAGHEHERAPGRIGPCAMDEKAHGALYDEEHVVFIVRVRAGPFGVRLEPPFRDRVLAPGFPAVGLENGGNASHRPGTAFAGTQDQWMALRGGASPAFCHAVSRR